MIYLVTKEKSLFPDTNIYNIIDVEQSLSLLSDCPLIQLDCETDGRDSHINKMLCIQFGNKEKDFQIVVDLNTVDISRYKDIIESKLIIGQNLKFDLQFLYSQGIVPTNIYDTMIAEQVLYLGFPFNTIGLPNHLITPYATFINEIIPKYPDWKKFKTDTKYEIMEDYNEEMAEFVYYHTGVSLKALCYRYLGITLDKEIRGQINYRGLDNDVILYSAKDVLYLEDIKTLQEERAREKGNLNAIYFESSFVPIVAYMEWCGIRIDEKKWKEKMIKDLKNLRCAETSLNTFVINLSEKDKRFKQFVYVNNEGDLFNGWDLEPKCTINWGSSQQVIKLCSLLGFNTQIEGEDKESVMEKHMKSQKGINDEFLKLYFGNREFVGYSGAAKVVTSFGQNHLNTINPITGRSHTTYKQLGADTGRMSCGSNQNNEDLAKLKGLPMRPNAKQKKEGLGCAYPNYQQLPHDAFTRSCFVANEGNMWVSCDFSGMEARLGADIYQEHAMIEEFKHGSGDIHSLTAKMVFKELKDVSIPDIKKKYPHLRTAAKPVGFCIMFGGSAFALQGSLGCTTEEAEGYVQSYLNGFKGILNFKKKSSKAVKDKGHIILCPKTGHRTYWWDYEYWKEVHNSFTPAFWEDYRVNHKGTGDSVCKKVSNHFKSATKWERKSLNSVTQGEGAVILKESQINLFKYIIDNNLFGKVLLCNLTHDEANWEYPKELTEFPNILKSYMENAAAKYCKSLPIPAEAEVSKCWVH